MNENCTLNTFAPVVRAAQYVRMSTDHQKYSIQNQIDAIADYGMQRKYHVVRTYADEGKSGLRFNGRSALKQLIADVQNREADYSIILVYDVSRWGRFQDADESAYYEFICRDAGIQIVYCAEQFENDGSVSSTILKSIKRAMAGEYSRELSNKVFIGQCRTVKNGFWRGSQAPFGLRRQLLDEHGQPRMLMEFGQRKNLQSDRVILQHGPSAEVATVQRVFRSYVTDKKSITTIASELNAEGLRTTRGMNWTPPAIDILLQNEIYVGNIIFNRKSYKLQRSYIDNPKEMWIRQDQAVAPVVSKAIFNKAQKLRVQRIAIMTDQEALDRLTALWKRRRHLSSDIIEQAKNVPSPSTYIKRFGSLSNAFGQIGFELKPRLKFMEGKNKVRSLMIDVVNTFTTNGIACYDEQTRVLTTSKGVVISLRVAWHYVQGLQRKSRWYLKGCPYAKPAIDIRSAWTLVVKMKAGNKKVGGYYLIPTSRLSLSRDRHFRFIRRVFADEFHYSSVEKLCGSLLKAG